jgi:MFS family permease
MAATTANFSHSASHQRQAPAPAAGAMTPSLRFIVTVAVMAATLLEVLDTSIVNVALPEMMGNLGATLDQIGWVSTGYIIAMLSCCHSPVGCPIISGANATSPIRLFYLRRLLSDAALAGRSPI